MYTKEQEYFAKYIMWGGIPAMNSPHAANEAARAAYPNIKSFQGQACHASHFLTVMVDEDMDSAKHLLSLLQATNPEEIQGNEGEPYYSFELVGSSIYHLRDQLPGKLRSGAITADEYIELYQATNGLDQYRNGVFGHPFLSTGHLNNLFRGQHMDAFEFIYSEFKARVNENSGAIFSSTQDVLGAFFAGRMELHTKIMNELSESNAIDRYSIMTPAIFFWKHNNRLINYLVGQNDNAKWDSAISMATEIFGMKRFNPLKAAVESGLAYRALEGAVDIFLAAKRQGYALKIEQIRDLLAPVERLSKSIGSHWSTKLNGDVSDKYVEVVSGFDQKEILGRRNAGAFITALHELMPKQAWVLHAKTKDKKVIMINELGI